MCRDLYDHYTMADGTVVHMFVDDEQNASAVHVAPLEAFGKPSNISDMLIDGLPPPPAPATASLREPWARAFANGDHDLAALEKELAPHRW